MPLSIRVSFAEDVREALAQNPLVMAAEHNQSPDLLINNWIGRNARSLLENLTISYRDRVKDIYVTRVLEINNRKLASKTFNTFGNSVKRRWGFIRNALVPNAYVGLYPPEDKLKHVEAFELHGLDAESFYGGSLDAHAEALVPWVVEKLGYPEAEGEVTSGNRSWHSQNIALSKAYAIASLNAIRGIPPALIFQTATKEFADEQARLISDFIVSLPNLPYEPSSSLDDFDSGLIP